MGPCRPADWEVSSAIHEWGGVTATDPGEIIQTDQMAIIPRSKTNDGVARTELSTRLAMASRKVYGYVAEIHEPPTTINTRTPYRLVVVAQLFFLQANWIEDSRFWAKTSAFSRNVLLANSTGVQLGSPVCGILAAPYGAHLATQLDRWVPATWGDWRLGGTGGIPKPSYFDLGPYTYDWLPTIGRSGFGLARLRWALPSVRLKPPRGDAREFHREVEKKKKNGGEKGPAKPSGQRGHGAAEIRKNRQQTLLTNQ